ncbi:MAG: zf-HC2 domain-containing protein [Elusimicrobia bacterium]|nr:zf-HC2 domain-containing protein [Elusimicrobiota bacterium]
MSGCERMNELLGAWLDGAATAEEAGAVGAHLASCAACRAQVRWLKALKAGVGACDVEMPARLKASLLARARAADRRRALRRRLREAAAALHRPLAVLGLAAAFAAVLLVLRARRVDTIPVSEMLAAHDSYALTLPLANQEEELSGLTDALDGERL